MSACSIVSSRSHRNSGSTRTHNTGISVLGGRDGGIKGERGGGEEGEGKMGSLTGRVGGEEGGRGRAENERE